MTHVESLHLSEELADAFERLSDWIGNCTRVSEELAPAGAQSLAATLDMQPLKLERDARLPPLWHWIYFKPCARSGEIGLDGHPRTGSFLPPVPLPRRMWAGSRVQWQPENPLVIGSCAVRRSHVKSIAPKVGRTGQMVFVTVVHEVFNAQGLSLREEQDIVYRGPAPLKDSMAPAAIPRSANSTGSLWERRLVPDEVMLFRYSALTFNAHRIHYDRPYATEREGYPGLVVHGPLIATLLVGLQQAHMPGRQLVGFSFKGVSPAIDGKGLRLNGVPEGESNRVRLWAENDDGEVLMQAVAELET